jgi:hypothetical protein
VEVEDIKDTVNHVNRQVEEKKVYNNVDMKNEMNSDDPERGGRKSEAPSFNGKPRVKDVCFGDEDHLGTKECRKAVRKYMMDNTPDVVYGPDVFGSIKKRMKNRFFLVRDVRKATWREAKKHEVISTIGEMWREQKRKTKS